jgi:hypothetical protein
MAITVRWRASWANRIRRLADQRFGYPGAMVGLIVALLVIWLILAVLGLVLKGLFWLFVVGAILFVATGGLVWFRRRT